jgi:hypothetical protein
MTDHPVPPWVEKVVQAVAELPDRTSPDDWPDAMLVTADELRGLLLAACPPPPEECPTCLGLGEIEVQDRPIEASPPPSEARAVIVRLRAAEQARLAACYKLPYDTHGIRLRNAYLQALNDVEAALPGVSPVPSETRTAP